MKVSIITPTYNSEKTLRDTIESVARQTYRDIEHIIIDGGSSDGTKKILKEYRQQLACIVSEKDNGIYDAMNKGIALSTGDIIGILNSDDFYPNSNVIADVIDGFKRNNCDAVYGNIRYVAPHDMHRTVRFWKSNTYSPSLLKYGWVPPHPTFFVKKDVYRKFGIFDLRFTISGDYELMIRFLKKGKISSLYLNKTLAVMRTGGASEKNMHNKVVGWLELYKTWIINGYGFPFLLPIRILWKINQYIKKYQ